METSKSVIKSTFPVYGIINTMDNTYKSTEDNYDTEDKKKENYTSIIIYNIIGIISAILSWKCNTKNNVNIPMKILFSFFAYMFGVFYIFYYLLFRYDKCRSL